jgi:hypothetical protein
MNRYMSTALDEFSKATKAALVLLATNATAFGTVGMEKHISGYDNERAAVVNSMNAVPVLYDIGFELGHRYFYGESNFISSSENETGFKNSMPRPYLQPWD